MTRLLAVVLAALLLAIPAPAHARTLVLFGDSVPADPPLRDYVASELGSSGHTDCPTSGDNYGVRTAEGLGLQAQDFSCSGATSPSVVSLLANRDFSQQVDRALTSAALDGDTARVLITVGFNDLYQGGTPDNFVAAMIPQIERIHDAAPNARVQIVGYPTITDGDDICVVNTDRVVRVHAPAVAHWERQAQHMQAELAAATGVEFVDLKESTRGRHMCAPDELRHWSAIIDDGPTNLPFHLNAHGHRHVAEVIARS
ncbi:Secreted hydrolase [Corynebacterium maris DSM 45190]|uniref:Secreted hydrolase n=1 Tax=Corynebacterium maris DSM 45190 TaxID=1224163 RepID=S5TGL9_9CORY|nr:SGNH/GDSL hydrolase family protein [Corynebacterium maris]AGS33823.1 Secreted hydrolase [Corynebacterium maris DSM 45190]